MQLPHHSLHERRDNDFYATRDMRAVPSLINLLKGQGIGVTGTVADLCCGEGHILRHFENDNKVFGSDIVNRGYKQQHETKDLLHWNEYPIGVKLHVSNLPYDRQLVDNFTQKLIDLTAKAKGTLCLLFRHQFAAGYNADRQALFNTPYFVGEFRLPFRPYFELPLFVWGKNITPSPQHPYAWYIWDFSKKWHGITRYAPDPGSKDIFLPEDLSQAHQIDEAGQSFIKSQLSAFGKDYIYSFERMRAGDSILSSNQKWYFGDEGKLIPNDLIMLLQQNKGGKRNYHLGTIISLNDGLPLLETSQSFKWKL